MPDYKSAAVLVWMPEGEEPTIESFQVSSDDQLPEATGYWELGAALFRARTPHPGMKVPWIKVDQMVLSPDECLRAYERFKSLDEPFDA